MSYTLSREIPVEDGYDVVVAGGGPAGATAAICAARLGAKVLLIEAMGCLGGMGTSGIVAAFGPMADGVRQLVRGFMGEMVEALYEGGYLEHGVNPDKWRKEYSKWTYYNVEGLKLLYDKFALEAGVEIRYFTHVVDADTDSGNHVNGVVISNIEGFKYIVAKTFIDATGDAVLANLCKAECREAYRDTPVGLPVSLSSLWANCDWDLGNKHHHRHQELLERAVDAGRFSQFDKHLASGMNRIGNTTGYLNIGHSFKINALRSADLTRAMIEGRQRALEYYDFFKKDVPGFSDMEIVVTAASLGIRESRRIIGEAEITKEDFLAKRQFPDQIGVYNRFMDIHPYKPTAEEFERFQRYEKDYQLGVGNCLGIPYGIIVPKGWSNLWVAGRCVSSDSTVLGTIRAQSCCSIMGQAAATAAVQSIKTGQPANTLDTVALQNTLKANGVYLPD